jgi:hypothetical protein
MKIDTTCIKHIDIFSISEAFDKLVASGGYSIDEHRVKTGDTPLNYRWICMLHSLCNSNVRG